ncbi:MAG TPA: helix-turn-helix transcriptional regulator [Pyrinomonadaceae bacterium]|nr:helix-turn-helix transcriptional regulator [Pyrinomonadaceae bacterium]
MGKQTRQRPERLPEKLLEIRQKLDLSQTEMVSRLGVADEIERDYISKYERGTLEPTLLMVLQYARVANIYVEVLIDDALDLPEMLPATRKSEGIKRQSKSTRKQLNKKIAFKSKSS